MFADSIESLMRNVIQKQKIDMANEVIDAGSFDNLTSDNERRQKLEAMLLVGATAGVAVHPVPACQLSACCMHTMCCMHMSVSYLLFRSLSTCPSSTRGSCMVVSLYNMLTTLLHTQLTQHSPIDNC